jgi:hypothetical protein
VWSLSRRGGVSSENRNVWIDHGAGLYPQALRRLVLRRHGGQHAARSLDERHREGFFDRRTQLEVEQDEGRRERRLRGNSLRRRLEQACAIGDSSLPQFLVRLAHET